MYDIIYDIEYDIDFSYHKKLTSKYHSFDYDFICNIISMISCILYCLWYSMMSKRYKKNPLLMYSTIRFGTASKATPQGRHLYRAGAGVELAIKRLPARCLDHNSTGHLPQAASHDSCVPTCWLKSSSKLHWHGRLIIISPYSGKRLLSAHYDKLGADTLS